MNHDDIERLVGPKKEPVFLALFNLQSEELLAIPAAPMIFAPSIEDALYMLEYATADEFEYLPTTVPMVLRPMSGEVFGYYPQVEVTTWGTIDHRENRFIEFYDIEPHEQAGPGMIQVGIVHRMIPFEVGNLGRLSSMEIVDGRALYAWLDPRICKMLGYVLYAGLRLPRAMSPAIKNLAYALMEKPHGS